MKKETKKDYLKAYEELRKEIENNNKNYTKIMYLAGICHRGQCAGVPELQKDNN